MVAQIPPGMKTFTLLDSHFEYWQVPLAKESRPLTTFLSPTGLKRFKRNIMGLMSAGDEHNHRGNDAIHGIDNVLKVTEDILILNEEPGKTHKNRVSEVLQRCREGGITLGRKKFVYSRLEVTWCGFRVNKHGYSVNPHLVSALKSFPIPQNKTDVCSFCGLVQQFECFIADIPKLAEPLRTLMSPKVPFIWEGPQMEAFRALQNALLSPRILTGFRPGAP